MEPIDHEENKLVVRYKATIQALTSLKNALDDLQKISLAIDQVSIDGLRTSRTYRNSLVKIFEISFDVFWKYVKDYLWMIHGIEQNSPKSVFRELYKTRITNDEQTKTLLNMVDHRNRLAHTYNEEVAIKISYTIPEYYQLMQFVSLHLKPTENF